MGITISRKDILWNYAGSILNISAGVLILPAILRMLPVDELGLWYVFSSISGLVMLMDFGFSPTIMRNVTYCWCGATRLVAEGTPPQATDARPNMRLLHSLIRASRLVYAVLALTAGALMFTAGTAYVIRLNSGNEPAYLLAWLIYASAIAVNLYCGCWTPLLKGSGGIKDANEVLVYAKILNVIASSMGLLVGGGLVWLSSVLLVTALLQGQLSRRRFLRLLQRSPEIDSADDGVSVRQVLRAIWPNCRRIGVVTLGAWLITRSTILLCSAFLGLEATAQYGLSLQLLGVIGGASSLLFNSYVPEIASAKVDGNMTRYRQIFSRAIGVQWLTGILGVTCLVLLGPRCLELVGTSAILLPGSTLALLGAVLFLEWNHSTFATLITLSNTVPFVAASLWSGACIVAASLFVLRFSALGVLGLVIAQGAVQLAYNNWYWPRSVFRRDGMSIRIILRSLWLDWQQLSQLRRDRRRTSTP